MEDDDGPVPGAQVEALNRTLQGENAEDVLPSGMFTSLTTGGGWSVKDRSPDQTSSPVPRSDIPRGTLPPLSLEETHRGDGGSGKRPEKELRVSVPRVGASRGSKRSKGESRGSRRTGGTAGSSKLSVTGGEKDEKKEEEAFATQEQIRVYIAKTQALQRKEREMRKQLVGLKEEIRTLEVERAAMGGREAVKRNARHLAHTEKVLSRRITRAREDRMQAKGANESIRAEINELRREKLSLQKAGNRLEEEVATMQRETEQKLVRIAATEESTRDLEARLASALEQSKEELREMERAWETLDRRSRAGKASTKLPEPKGAEEEKREEEELQRREKELSKEPKHVPRDIYDTARAGPKGESDRTAQRAAELLKASRREKALEKRSKKKPSASDSRPGSSASAAGGGSRRKSGVLTKTRWRSALLQAKVSRTEDRLSSLKAIFEQVQKRTGVASVEEFADRFVQANEENHALYDRCDQLASEADGLRKEILAARAQSRVRALKQRVEDGERRGLLAPVDASLDAVRDRCDDLQEEQSALESAARAMQDGLIHLLEALDLTNECRAVIEKEGGSSFARTLEPLMRLAQTSAEKRISTFGRLRRDVNILDALRAKVVASSEAIAHAAATHDATGAHEAARAINAVLTVALEAAGKDADNHKRPSSNSSSRRRQRSKKKQVMSAAERRGSVDLSVLEVRKGLLLAAQEGMPNTLVSPHTASFSLSTAADPSASSDDAILPPTSLIVGPHTPAPSVVVRSKDVVQKQAATIYN